MSEQEKFLQRWSRRKQEAESEASQPAEKPEPSENSEEERRGSSLSPAKSEEGKPAFDLESLPSLDSITATTDIRAFLTPGVPEELKHAALRRVWHTDPAIRDFVGLSENSWDFNDPAGAHGFGPFEVTEQLKKAVEAMFERTSSEAEKESGEEKSDDMSKPAEPVKIAERKASDKINNQIFEKDRTAPSEKTDVAPPQKVKKVNSRNAHGGALPK
jgi:hypothetical protein